MPACVPFSQAQALTSSSMNPEPERVASNLDGPSAMFLSLWIQRKDIRKDAAMQYAATDRHMTLVAKSQARPLPKENTIPKLSPITKC